MGACQENDLVVRTKRGVEGTVCKGIVSRDEYYLGRLIIIIIGTFCPCADSSFYNCLVDEKIELKV